MRLPDLENRAKVSVENQTNRAEPLVKQNANVVWSSRTFRRDVRDKRERKAKKRRWAKSQQSAVVTRFCSPSEGEREADNEDEGDEDDWAEIAREERMAKEVKRGETSQLEFDAEFV
jgi:ATP-dependent RNA helicase DDX55/SPB4